ncbi:unknown protein [Seminavis robusta]|uniref:Uncharacterized protein n=1 Tax=Seminavis robusta TaxID=568900 RepID=A0A9N8EQK3_9STRA|nr:unknown protein [Seminavis robusta]|eukprot:Sro1417_g270890.1 n/a (267) ;mRNA; f:5691-6642
MDRDELVERALEVYRSIPEWGETYLSREDCLVAVGMPEKDAMLEAVKKQFDRRRQGLEQRYGRPELENTVEANTKRALFMWKSIVEHPTTGRKPTQAYAMELAGFKKEDRKAGAKYMKVKRAIDSYRKKAQAQEQEQPMPAHDPVARATQPPAAAPTLAPVPRAAAARPRPVLSVEFDVDSDAGAILSPISTLGGPTERSVVSFDEDKEEASFFNTPPDFRNKEMKLLFDSVYLRRLKLKFNQDARSTISANLFSRQLLLFTTRSG